MASPPTPQPTDRSAINPLGEMMAVARNWWASDVAKDVNHEKVMLRITDESALTPRYAFMICMSAGIAVLGLLLSSPAVVIGAMLLSPLMGPIIGAGFALAEGKFTWLRLCAKALFVGTLLAVLFCAAIVWLSPLQTVTEEIASRTRPNLFDLLVALFSSLAGSYAFIRGREGTIVGVAIATALMPPLAVVGYGLATLNMAVFGGALLLYVTNLLTIALTATAMARLYGFRSKKQKKRELTESLGIAGTFILLAIPLGISLSQIARETNGQRIVSSAIDDSFDPVAETWRLTVDWDVDPILVTATVFTPDFRSDVEAQLRRTLSRQLEEDVVVRIEQLQVGADQGAAQQAALARTRESQQAEATERQIVALGERLALVAGVSANAVTIDRENRRALVSAAPLDGLTLSGYRALEARVAAQAEGWEVRLRPPLLQLPDIPLRDGAPSQIGREHFEQVVWAARRTGVPLVLSGPGEPVAALVDTLAQQGVEASAAQGDSAEQVSVAWSTG